jgi:hypothetical protein
VRRVVHYLLWALVGLFASYAISTSVQVAMAHADVSGVPNLPSYPCIGPSGLAAIVPYTYYDCPTEANGVHYHCEQGGPNLSGGAFTGSNGVGFGGLGQFGFVFGGCSWRWPDNTTGPAPNPPGAWRSFLVPSPIPIQHTSPVVQPYDQTADVAPPPILPPAPPADAPPDAPAPVAAPLPQVLPPPVVAQPTIQPPVLQPNVTEVLPAPPKDVGAPVPPGEGIVPNLSPKDLNPTSPDRDSLRPRGN